MKVINFVPSGKIKNPNWVDLFGQTLPIACKQNLPIMHCRSLIIISGAGMRGPLPPLLPIRARFRTRFWTKYISQNENLWVVCVRVYGPPPPKWTRRCWWQMKQTTNNSSKTEIVSTSLSSARSQSVGSKENKTKCIQETIGWLHKVWG